MDFNRIQTNIPRLGGREAGDAAGAVMAIARRACRAACVHTDLHVWVIDVPAGNPDAFASIAKTLARRGYLA